MDSTSGGDRREFGIELDNGKRVVDGIAYGVKAVPFSFEHERGEIAGSFHAISLLCWNHTKGLLFTEGATMYQLFSPAYMFVQGERSKPYAPRPHLKNLVLASFSKVPQGMHLLEVFSVIRRKLVDSDFSFS